MSPFTRTLNKKTEGNNVDAFLGISRFFFGWGIAVNLCLLTSVIMLFETVVVSSVSQFAKCTV